MQLVKGTEAAEGFDPRTGVHRDSLKWAIEALYTQRPGAVKPFEELLHWLNALSGLASAYVRAGGSMEELRHLETTDGSFFWSAPGGFEREWTLANRKEPSDR